MQDITDKLATDQKKKQNIGVGIGINVEARREEVLGLKCQVSA